jgi:acyl-lipid (7-3)-desaturase (Delta-4 desaturase)
VVVVVELRVELQPDAQSQLQVAQQPAAIETMAEKVVNKIEEKTIQVDDKVYSAKILASDHPGGDLFVKAFAGRDATEAFMSYHRRKFPHQKMEYAAVGKAIAVKSPEADKDYLELCELIDKVLPRNKAFAPFHYYLKVFFILSVALGLEVILY